MTPKAISNAVIADAVAQTSAGTKSNVPVSPDWSQRPGVIFGSVQAPGTTEFGSIACTGTRNFSTMQRRFDRTIYDDVASEMTARFGGLTAYARAPAIGLWLARPGDTRRL